MSEQVKTDMSRHYGRLDLLKYALPSIIMMFTVSIYTIIDGYFISNFVNSTAFAAVNLIFPLLTIFASFGMMIGSGSSAIIANKMGEKEPKIANKYFSMFVYFVIILGVAISIIGIFLIRPVAGLLGAEGELLEIAVYYGLLSLISMPAYMLQMSFMSFCNTAGRPNIGFVSALCCCASIFLLDLIFVAFMNMGINGILIATIFTEYLGAIIPFCYFLKKKNKSLLHLISPLKAFKNQNPRSCILLIRASINGSSEAVQEIATSLVVLLCMYQINRFIGEPGVVAYGVIGYAWIIFNAFYLGYSVAVAPLMSYQQGAKNKREMKSLYRCSMTIIVVAALLSFALAELCTPMVVGVFVGYDTELIDISVHAFRIYSISFAFAGFSIYGSSLFTSLGNGLISALIAFLRTLVFSTILLLVIPEIFGADGIWWAIVVAEILSTILTFIFIKVFGKKIGILKR